MDSKQLKGVSLQSKEDMMLEVEMQMKAERQAEAKEILRNHPGASKADWEYNQKLVEKELQNRAYLEHLKKVEMTASNLGTKTGEPKLLEDIIFRFQELVIQNRNLADSITKRLNLFYDSGENEIALVNMSSINEYAGFLAKAEYLNSVLELNNGLLVNIDEKLKRLI